jgi:molybdopterin/thiamine biosynthesis adenylyltransferase/molybdopterin synthase catalytic subunit/rhodanese-related sulfurtransferase
MARFEFSDRPLDPTALHATVEDRACGGFASFEGWVRDCNDGRPVERLEYEAYALLAEKEGERIVAAAIERFGVTHARCVHRVGDLALGELAVWIGVSAPHRGEAFAACRYIIDEVKHRVPIWKKEHYVDGDSGWVNCERCAAAPTVTARAHDHDHGHGGGHAHHGHAPAPVPAAIGIHAAGLPVPDYSRQSVLPEVGDAGQARLRAARVLVIGAGGLGAPLLGYLAGAGIGTLGIVDGDVLDASNLHRQTIYALADVGRPKALLAAARLRALNPEVDVRAYVERADRAQLPALAAGYDVLVDCSDNFATRFVVNDVAVRLGKPAVAASIYQYEGQLQVVKPGGPCVRCVWPRTTRPGVVGNCAEAGVLGPVPGVLGSLQALEVIKLVLGMESPACDGVLLVDLRTLETRRLRARRAAGCAGGPCTELDAADPGAGRDVELELDLGDAAAWQAYTLVDVRDPDEIARAPLPVARLQVTAARLAAGEALPDETGAVLLVCARGQRSLAAAEALLARGHREVRSLKGGLAGQPRRG